jgi:hypothetical protein
MSFLEGHSELASGRLIGIHSPDAVQHVVMHR